jgi:hypothetical protein
MELIAKQCAFVAPAQFEDPAQSCPAEDAGPSPASDQGQEDECSICLHAAGIYRAVPCRCGTLFSEDCKNNFPVGLECHVCKDSRPRITGYEPVR